MKRYLIILTIVTLVCAGVFAGLRYTDWYLAIVIAMAAYVVIPPLVLFVLGAKYSMRHRQPGQFWQSIWLWLCFAVVTVLVQARDIYVAVGWEQSFALSVVSTYIILVIVISLITNTLVYVLKVKPKLSHQ
ncbi:MAG: hypothetical protein HYV33_05620 [Candidatus Kerfeldbacteria bacterium]|nr:hypothetical protein [Candidatus Kerfeldbacteria bacterium]